jgi:hypothetical protein
VSSALRHGGGRAALAVLLLLCGGASPGAQNAPVSLDAEFSSKIRGYFSAYCYKCHGPQLKPKGDLNLVKYQSERAVRENRKLFKDVMAKIHTLEMPPKDFTPQPPAEERRAMAEWVEKALNRVDPSEAKNPGRVVFRRLNRLEYRNTVRDLLGVDYNAQADFPADDIGYGFDNIGDVLSLPPLLMEKYLAAARKISDQAVQGKDKDRLIFTAKPEGAKKPRDAAREVLTRLVGRAFRRAPFPDEVEKFLKLFDVGEKQEAGFEPAMKLPIRGLLISPHFLFRVEPSAGDGISPVGDFELASRLSYFLWSTMPDDELLDAAKAGKLKDPKTLEAQVLRMLKDPRAAQFPENFAPQWLQVRRLLEVQYDPKLFPGMDKGLKEDMIREVVLYFETIMKEDRSVLELIDSDFTVVNDRLARHYGIAGAGGGFAKVKLADARRGGVLTMAAVLAATSDPNRTSPVKRGKWVLEAILGSPPPPPIPGADNLVPAPGDGNLTLRQKMERHRTDPNCNSCHSRMDPIGFGFENYDAIGQWRDRDGNQALDTSATLPDGKAFKGPVELKAILKARQAEFVGCLVEKLFTYGLGRGVEPYDGVTADQVAAAASKNGYKFSSLIVEIVKSFPFQYRMKERSKK